MCERGVAYSEKTLSSPGAVGVAAHRCKSSHDNNLTVACTKKMRLTNSEARARPKRLAKPDASKPVVWPGRLASEVREELPFDPLLVAW